MKKKQIEKLTTPQEVEEAFVGLFNKIDDGVNDFLKAIEGNMLKEQAMRDIIGMLEILRVINQKDFQVLFGSAFVADTDAVTQYR